MKAFVGIACSREWSETDFMTQLGTFRTPHNWQVNFGWLKQFSAAERHNVAMLEAYHNYDRILFMDTDQYYPPEYLELMLAHTEPVVTALNVSRYYPFDFTVYTIDAEVEYDGITVPRFTAKQPPADQQVFTCDMTGTGALMVDPQILGKIEKPYFKDVYDREGASRLLCDDFYFCWQLHKAGIPIVCDQGIVVHHAAKIKAGPGNVRDLRRAFDKVEGGHGMWKDGKKA